MKKIGLEEQERLLRIFEYNALQRQKGVSPLESTHGEVVRLKDLPDVEQKSGSESIIRFIA